MEASACLCQEPQHLQLASAHRLWRQIRQKAFKWILQVPFHQRSVGIAWCFLAIETNAISLDLHNFTSSWFVEMLSLTDLGFSFSACVSIRSWEGTKKSICSMSYLIHDEFVNLRNSLPSVFCEFQLPHLEPHLWQVVGT